MNMLKNFFEIGCDPSLFRGLAVAKEKKICDTYMGKFPVYWANTSGNDVVRRFIEMAQDQAAKREIEQLVAGETIEKEIRQELTYKDMYQSIDNLWSVLFTTGYLTQRARVISIMVFFWGFWVLNPLREFLQTVKPGRAIVILS